MTVENYDFCCDSFLSSQAGFLKEVGDEGEHEGEAKEILGMECGENDSEAWADIMFSTSTGKQYAVCGTAAATAPEGVTTRYSRRHGIHGKIREICEK